MSILPSTSGLVARLRGRQDTPTTPAATQLRPAPASGPGRWLWSGYIDGDPQPVSGGVVGSDDQVTLFIEANQVRYRTLRLTDEISGEVIDFRDGTAVQVRPPTTPAPEPVHVTPVDVTPVDIGPGGLFLGGVADGYIGWDGYTPGLQVDDGVDLTQLPLNGAQIREFRDRLAATLATATTHPVLDTPVGVVSWQPTADGRYQFQVAPVGEQPRSVTLTRAELAAVSQQLGDDLAVEDAATATFPGVTGRLADRIIGVLDNDAELTLPGGVPAADLPAVSRALRLYRCSTFKSIGAYLRGGDDETVWIREQHGAPRVAERIPDHVGLIDVAMRAAPLAHPTVVYRGIGGSRLPDGDTTGHTWTESSYQSTSVDPTIAAIFGPVLLKLHVPAGVGALQLDSRPTKRDHTREAEVLLQRGLVMRVTADRTEDIVADVRPTRSSRCHRVLSVEVTLPPHR